MYGLAEEPKAQPVPSPKIPRIPSIFLLLSRHSPAHFLPVFEGFPNSFFLSFEPCLPSKSPPGAFSLRRALWPPHTMSSPRRRIPPLSAASWSSAYVVLLALEIRPRLTVCLGRRRVLPQQPRRAAPPSVSQRYLRDSVSDSADLATSM